MTRTRVLEQAQARRTEDKKGSTGTPDVLPSAALERSSVTRPAVQAGADPTIFIGYAVGEWPRTAEREPSDPCHLENEACTFLPKNVIASVPDCSGSSCAAFRGERDAIYHDAATPGRVLLPQFFTATLVTEFEPVCRLAPPTMT